MFYYSSSKTDSPSDSERSKNFDFLHEGDIESVLGKKIEVLIENGRDFIVYLDPEMNIQYAVSPFYGAFSQFYGMVLNKVAELEGLADSSFMTKNQIKDYRSMLGAAIARMYEHENRDVIFSILEKAEYFLKSRVTETAKIWYLSSATAAIVLSTAIYFLYFYLADPVPEHTRIFASGIIMGGMGAYLSLIMNSKKINVNPASGRNIHYFESITRLIIGMIGGFFTALVFFSGIINPGGSGNRFINILIFSFTAGFGERIVPNLINHFENQSQGSSQKELVKKKT